ncbi:DMT family transporter [Serratia quinivorans]|uniref:DMT family transporter n=1 Tax=Serratia quinivorans TaxID=137545 RepID=UPI00217ADE22|nr:DMT family transporter [Serratia quinivorans]CAI0802673.1 Inner membrane protein ytfF [Serratia quinivorans]CAI0827836.1 Inner membrane protein ytfF [Serratia quinivorans]CAI1737066.1 Inner membrane protein ytfF [Serratia quinivorans]CAI2068466.1 Inner membrane protein ytfF [Serratia quinivorans]CAI2116122.1 Inner membrane protein ytfF [Serratia quinivorans]
MLFGVLFALAAGLMWGLIFVGPLLIPDYPAALQSTGRYLAFGLIALPLAWLDRQRLKKLHRNDWLEALKLTAIGNLLYYLCLASAIQRTGAPISTMIIGTLPVVISVTANLFYSRHDGRLSWRKLTPALVLIACGLALVNVAELRGNTAPIDVWRYTSGLGLALLAVACWTWFPLRNARWLRNNPSQRPATWATAQGLVTLPLALVGYLLVCGQLALTQPTFALPFGPRPEVFVPLMIAIGMLCSWIGALCWNEASQRLPTVLVGPLIVFEILAGLAYTFMLRQAWPPLLTLGGISCLIIGVIYAMRIKPQPVVVPLTSKE